MKTIKTLTSALIVGFTGLFQTNAQEVELAPVSVLKETVSPEKVLEYRRGYSSKDFFS